MIKFFNKHRTNAKDYLDRFLSTEDKNPYSYDKKYLNQDSILYKIFGNADLYDKHIKMIIISDTHGCLNEIDFSKFIMVHNNYDICILLGDHSYNDVEIVLKYVDKSKLYGLLGNHDYNYLSEYNISNLNGNIINVNNTRIMGVQGSFKYKNSNSPLFSQQESILFLKDKPKVDILVSHDNRFDDNRIKDPAHQGLFGISYYLFKNKIPYHIHGHIHESYSKVGINGYKEISVYMFEYIEL